MLVARIVYVLALGIAMVPTRASASPGAVVRIEHRDPTTLPSRGPANAPVTIEVFFTPGQTSRIPAYRLLEKLQEQHPSELRLVYRVLGGNGNARLPYAALEAYAQAKFFELMDKLNCVNVPAIACRTRNGLTTKEILDIGVEIGMDPDRLEAAMADPPPGYRRVLDANELRRRQRVRTTALPAVLFAGRAPRTQLAAMTPGDLDREYRDAKQRADDLLDRGADPNTLADALDAQVDDASDPVVLVGGTDEDFDQPTGPPTLASPPLSWEGLPSFGNANAPVTIAVLCSPSSTICASPLRAALTAEEDFPERVRVVWAPFFDVRGDDARELAALGDAALCAEQLGTAENNFDRPASAGWPWVDAMFSHTIVRRHGAPAEPVIDKVADKLHLEHAAFAECRARLAGTTLAWIERARKSGVHLSPAMVIGGRIYPPIIDGSTVQQLALAELAPGVLRDAVYWLGGLATVRAPHD